MPEHRQDARAIFGARADYYVTSAVHTDAETLARLVTLARPNPADRALDIGTAAAHTAFALAPAVRRVVGLDVTPEMLACAVRLRGEKGLTNVEFVQADAQVLPFCAGAFDIVACRRAAHHFTDLAGALEEMARVLRPGGRLAVDDRCVPEDDLADALMNRLDVLHDRSHVREWRPNEWRRLLEGMGFRVVSVETYLQHRPLTSLTENAAPDDAAEVERTVAVLDAAGRAALGVDERAGAPWTDHWYMLAGAVRV